MLKELWGGAKFVFQASTLWHFLTLGSFATCWIIYFKLKSHTTEKVPLQLGLSIGFLGQRFGPLRKPLGCFSEFPGPSMPFIGFKKPNIWTNNIQQQQKKRPYIPTIASKFLIPIWFSGGNYHENPCASIQPPRPAGLERGISDASWPAKHGFHPGGHFLGFGWIFRRCKVLTIPIN